MSFRKSSQKSEQKKPIFDTFNNDTKYDNIIINEELQNDTITQNGYSMVTRKEQKKHFRYICEKCCFKSNNKSHYDKHLQTIKHNGYSMVTPESEKEPACYICEKCCYKSNKKANYDKHLQTKKHNGYSMVTQKEPEKASFSCVCGNSYQHKQGLSRHKQQCMHVKNEGLIVYDNVQNDNIQNNELLNALQTITTSNIVNSEKPVINIIINNSYETIQTKANTVTNNTTNAPSFSVKNYLNTECKDAYNISDVIDNFECDILKLPQKTISFYKCILDKVFDMPIEKFPIRCSDAKRKTFFGKEGIWTKEFDVIEHFIKKLVDVVCELRNQYSRRNPDWHDNDIISNLMNSLIRNITAIYDDTTCKHIVSYIAEKTKIAKNTKS